LVTVFADPTEITEREASALAQNAKYHPDLQVVTKSAKN